MRGQLQALGTIFLDHAVPKKETGESLHQKLITLLSFGKRTVNKKHMNTTELPNPQRDLE